jgi:CBS domain-containing protein
MKTIAIKELMVPIEEYATVYEDATLSEAIRSLEKAQQTFDHTKYRHRGVLVLDKAGRVVGKISQLDALKALEPKYKEIEIQGSRNAFRHFSKIFLKTMQDHYRLFDSPLEELRKKADMLKVKDFMYTPSTDECLNENATLDEAIHVLIMGHHQSVLVTRNNKIVGILRLTDAFAAVFQSLSGLSLK